jgi:hypothetical protein
MMEPKRIWRDRCARVLRAQWTILRERRGIVVSVVVTVLFAVLIGLPYVAARNTPVSVGCGRNAVCSTPTLPTEEAVGPDGELVEDKFYFVYQPLVGNGSITARLTSLTGEFVFLPPNARGVVLVSGVEPWAKVGVIIKASTTQGSPYAAMMMTGSHGVRMQDNFTHDIAGLPGRVSAASPRRLRLTRSGSTLTGYESINGIQWTRVGVAHLAGLPATVQVGIFVTSPCHLTGSESGGSCSYAPATAVFDHVNLQGEAPRGAWSRDDVGVTIQPDGKPHHPGSFAESGGIFTVTGNGDITALGTTGGAENG